jgi:hypothetical protein
LRPQSAREMSFTLLGVYGRVFVDIKYVIFYLYQGRELINIFITL